MSIGLSSQELTGRLIQRFSVRFTEFSGSIQAMKAGENPSEVKALFDALPIEYRQQLLENIEQAVPSLALLQTIADIIADNNKALAKVIPHVES